MLFIVTTLRCVLIITCLNFFLIGEMGGLVERRNGRDLKAFQGSFQVNVDLYSAVVKCMWSRIPFGRSACYFESLHELTT